MFHAISLPPAWTTKLQEWYSGEDSAGRLMNLAVVRAAGPRLLRFLRSTLAGDLFLGEILIVKIVEK